MRLLIATPLYPPDIGGPATYAKGLEDEFKRREIETTILSFREVRHLPKGISHFVYTLKLLRAAVGTNAIIILDPVSVGIPALFARFFFGVPLLIRIGGDTLWERYVERTNNMIPLSRFYSECLGKLSMKERAMFRLIKFFLRRAHRICFSTEWQQGLWRVPYGISPERTHIIENVFPAVTADVARANKKIFLWAGREILLKNTAMLQSVFEEVKVRHPDIVLEMKSGVSHEELLELIKGAYALVLPSLSDISPNFILEGLSMGKPFILTKETGIKSGIGSCGEFIDPTNAADLTRAFERMLDPSTYEEYCVNIRALSRERTYKDIVDELLGLINTTA